MSSQGRSLEQPEAAGKRELSRDPKYSPRRFGRPTKLFAYPELGVLLLYYEELKSVLRERGCNLQPKPPLGKGTLSDIKSTAS